MNANIRRLLEDAAVDRAPSCIDLGCGNGAVCFWLAERGARVLGVDRALPLPPGVPATITGVSPGSVVLVNADVLDFDPGGPFETVITFGLLHSLGSPERVAQVLERIATWSAPGGRLLLSWLLDAIPPAASHAQAHFPPAEVVDGALGRLGFEVVTHWTARLEHAHHCGPAHAHQAVYSSWRRRS
ncbi:MAG: methyltransferase domain-containing protein [Myxococcaceae bacterium]|nr:methyltransferase domain-containing protein [Myxococcaceae bacterium]